jgi:hypothetical protein
MKIDILRIKLDTRLMYALEVEPNKLYNSLFNVTILRRLSHDKHVKTISISKDEYEKLTSNDITVAKMTSNILIHRYTKLNIDEGDE